MSNVRIGDVCQVFDGPHATPTKIAEGPVYLGIDAITEDGRLNPSEYTHLSEEDYKIWTKRVTPQKDDIVFSYEATLGRYAIIPDGFYGCLGRRLAIVRAKDDRVNPRWLYYYFLSPQWTVFIANHTVRGSTVDRISVEDFPQYHIPLPKREKQDSVVEILSKIDHRIDTNTCICTELESMAKTLYNYWFTQFDFPDAEGKPYRSSGGAMEWNDQLKREIPKGWNLGSVDSLMKIENTSVNPQKLGAAIMEHYSIPAFDVDHNPSYEKATSIESGKYSVDPECILTSKLNPHFKRLWDPYCDTENAICSTEFIVYRPRTSWTRPFCYAVLDSDAFYAHMSGKATASTGSRKRIQPDVSASFELAIPDEKTMRAFVELYAPIMEKKKALYRENRELTKLRDWLLPMLMNGQATVAPTSSENTVQFPVKSEVVEVLQAARSFSGSRPTLDDTADLVRYYKEHK